MAEWDWDIEQDVGKCYTPDFEFEVRGHLANFFQANNTFWSWDPQCPSADEKRLIDEFIATMKRELENIYTHLPTGRGTRDYNKRFRGHCDKVLQNTNHLQLFQLIRDSLQIENNVLQGNGQKHPPNAEPMDTIPPPLTTYENLKLKINLSLNNCKEACVMVKSKVVNLRSRWTALRNQPHSPQEEMIRQLNAEKDVLDHEGSECISNLTVVHEDILKMLEDFKEKQRFVTFAFKEKSEEGTPETRTTHLDDIQSWLDKFRDCVAEMSAFLQWYDHLFGSDTSSTKSVDWSTQGLCLGGASKDMRAFIWEFTEKTKAVAFVIECQPYQAIRTKINYELKVRVLPWTNRDTKISNVNTVLINKATAIEVVQKSFGTIKSIPVTNPMETTKHLDLPTSSGKIAAEHHSTDRKLVSVINLKINEITRGEKQPGKSVVEEKYWLYFRVDVDVDLTGFHGKERFFFHALSLPICILSHTNSQEEICLPHLIWFNAFPSTKRTCHGLDVPNTQKWTCLLELIDLEFLKLGRSLTHEQADFLKVKLFRGIARPDDLVNFEDFYEKSIEARNFTPVQGPSNASSKPPKSFSFFEWLHDCLTVLNSDTHPNTKSLKELWADGKIMGFMEKQRMQETVESRGTCVIFFPESLKGTISVHYYNSKAGRLTKDSYTITELIKKPLEERILEKTDISHLYSNFTGEGRLVRKKEAFKIKPITHNVIINGAGYIFNPPIVSAEDPSIIYFNSTAV